jgi:hypothetical protein
MATNRPDIDQTKPVAVKIKRAAKLLDLCERSVRRHADNGLLESFYIGGSRLITYASIEKLLGQNEAA